MTSLPAAVHLTGPDDATAEPFRVFVGYDSREDLAYRVCRRSLLRRSSIPLEVIPIVQQELREAGLYWRERGPTESTEFSFTRFLTPHLAGYDGWALFVDCDFLFTADVAELARMADPRYAVLCVHHDYAPKEATKMDGAVQTLYPRKNWSSMVLFNCGHPKNRAALTPEAVSTRSGAHLHRFAWLDDADVGEVPFAWNFLVGHNRVDPDDVAGTTPRAIHYTSGGPWFERYRDCDFADLWIKERDAYVSEEKGDGQLKPRGGIANSTSIIVCGCARRMIHCQVVEPLQLAACSVSSCSFSMSMWIVFYCSLLSPFQINVMVF